MSGLLAPSIDGALVRVWLTGLLTFSVLASSDTVLDEHYGIPSPSVLIALLALVVVGGQTLRTSGKPLLQRRPEFEHYGLILAAIVGASLPGALLDIDNDLYLTVQDARLRNIVIATAFVVLIRSRRATRAVLVASFGALVILIATSALHRFGGGSGMAFKGLASEVESELANGEHGNRTAGPFGDGNFFAQHLVVVGALAVGSAVLVRRRWYRLLVGMTIVVATPIFITTFSRGGLAAVAVALLMARAHRAGLARVTVGIAALALIVVMFGPSTLLDRVGKVQDLTSYETLENSEDSSLRGRASELIVGTRIFADHPLVGVGYGNYEQHYLDYSAELGLDLRRADRGAHSFPIEILAEQGLFGAFAWLCVGAYLWRSIRRRLNDLTEIAVIWRTAMIGYTTAALLLHDAYPRMLWFLLGTGFAIAHLPHARTPFDQRKIAAGSAFA